MLSLFAAMLLFMISNHSTSFLCIEGDFKDWSELSHVERQSAEWLGYNEMRWSVRLNQAFLLFSFS